MNTATKGVNSTVAGNKKTLIYPTGGVCRISGLLFWFVYIIGLPPLFFSDGNLLLVYLAPYRSGGADHF